MVAVTTSTLRSNKGNFKIEISEDFLRHEYLENKKTMQEIADMLGCCINTVNRRLSYYDIPSRPPKYWLKDNDFAKGENNYRWKGGNDQYWKRQLISLHGHQCQVCNFNTVVQVHHIDENRENNNISNLVLLCPNCHYSIHHANYVLHKEENKWLLSKLQV